jgi:hypothetical protein
VAVGPRPEAPQVHPSSALQTKQVQDPSEQAYKREPPFAQASYPFEEEPSLGELPSRPQWRRPWAVGWLLLVRGRLLVLDVDDGSRGTRLIGTSFCFGSNML